MSCKYVILLANIRRAAHLNTFQADGRFQAPAEKYAYETHEKA